MFAGTHKQIQEPTANNKPRADRIESHFLLPEASLAFWVTLGTQGTGKRDRNGHQNLTVSCQGVVVSVQESKTLTGRLGIRSLICNQRVGGSSSFAGSILFCVSLTAMGPTRSAIRSKK